MKLYGIRIFVDDLAAARRFYGEDLGLTVLWDVPEMGAFGVKVGEPVLIIEAVAEGGEHRDLVGRFVGLSLSVDDIQATYEAMTGKGVAFDGPPVQQPWGGSLAHFRDPAGNTLTLLG